MRADLKEFYGKTLCLTLLFISCQAHAEDFRGRVVGITDGDTITVLHDGRGGRLLEPGPGDLPQVWPLGKK